MYPELLQNMDQSESFWGGKSRIALGQYICMWEAKDCDWGPWAPGVAPFISSPVLHALKLACRSVSSMLAAVQHHITSDKEPGVGSIPFKSFLPTIIQICCVNLQKTLATTTARPWRCPGMVHSFSISTGFAAIAFFSWLQVGSGPMGKVRLGDQALQGGLFWGWMLIGNRLWACWYHNHLFCPGTHQTSGVIGENAGAYRIKYRRLPTWY